MNSLTIQKGYIGILDKLLKSDDQKDLTIFIVDDDTFYAKLLKKQLNRNSRFDVHIFSSGEACIYNLNMCPDLIILDYHLDGSNKDANKGDVILNAIKELRPATEVVIISGDEKIKFVGDIVNEGAIDVVSKNDDTTNRLKSIISNLFFKKIEKFSLGVLIGTLILIILSIVFLADIYFS